MDDNTLMEVSNSNNEGSENNKERSLTESITQEEHSLEPPSLMIDPMNTSIQEGIHYNDTDKSVYNKNEEHFLEQTKEEDVHKSEYSSINNQKQLDILSTLESTEKREYMQFQSNENFDRYMEERKSESKEKENDKIENNNIPIMVPMDESLNNVENSTPNLTISLNDGEYSTSNVINTLNLPRRKSVPTQGNCYTENQEVIRKQQTDKQLDQHSTPISTEYSKDLKINIHEISNHNNNINENNIFEKVHDDSRLYAQFVKKPSSPFISAVNPNDASSFQLNTSLNKENERETSVNLDNVDELLNGLKQFSHSLESNQTSMFSISKESSNKPDSSTEYNNKSSVDSFTGKREIDDLITYDKEGGDQLSKNWEMLRKGKEVLPINNINNEHNNHMNHAYNNMNNAHNTNMNHINNVHNLNNNRMHLGNVGGIHKIEMSTLNEKRFETIRNDIGMAKMKNLEDIIKPTESNIKIKPVEECVPIASLPKININKHESAKVMDTQKSTTLKMKSPKQMTKPCQKVPISFSKDSGTKLIKTPKTMRASEKTAMHIPKIEKMPMTMNRMEKGHMNESDMTYNMNVVIRCRPMSQSEKNDGAKNVIKILDKQMVVLLDPADNSDNVLRQNRSREKRYMFDYAFDETCSTREVYTHTVKNLIEGVIKGYNSTVFAYGATGAGKTHTIIGYKDEPGIMYMILEDLFLSMKNMKLLNDYKVLCSFIEIYNENIVDLLNPSSEYLDVREDPKQGVTVSNIFQVCTTSVEEIMELIHKGNRNRTQEPTDANKTSSRSHGILQIIVEETEKGQGVCQQTKRGKLCVIDLAGSERASQTNNKGIRMLEGANINRSLLALGNVINALVCRSKGTSKSNFIPFRDSKLTRLLKDSLGGNCRTVMIANISPSHLSYEDTHNTLKYANRAKNIKMVVTSNAVEVKHHVSMYHEIIKTLKSEIEYLKEQLHERELTQGTMSSCHSVSSHLDFEQMKENENSTREELLQIIANLRHENEQIKMNMEQMSTDHAIELENRWSNYETEMNMIEEERNHHKEEIGNLKLLNEKLFSDNKNFQSRLQEYMSCCQHLKDANEELKKQVEEYKGFLKNNEMNLTLMKAEMEEMKKKYSPLEDNTQINEKENRAFERWKSELTKLLNDRKKIKSIIFEIEKKIIEVNEIQHRKLPVEEFKIMQSTKEKNNQELKINVAQTNNLLKELPNEIKDEKMKNFLYLYYTNKVLLQEKEELQGFFELSSNIINHKEKQIELLKRQLQENNTLTMTPSSSNNNTIASQNFSDISNNTSI